MVTIPGPKPDARSVIQPQASFLWLLWWDFQPFSLPKPFDPLVIDMPASVTQESGNPTITVTAVLAAKLEHIGDQSLLRLLGPLGRVAGSIDVV